MILKKTTTKIILSAGILLAGLSAHAQGLYTKNASEYEVKAAFLYNFAKFVTWSQNESDSSNESFIIGIAGRDPFGNLIEQVMGSKTVLGKQIQIRRYRSVYQAGLCHILFVSESEKNNYKQILKLFSGRPVLTVSDADGFIEAGGMIRLYVADNKIRFEINVRAAEKAKLKLSSKLLYLATNLKNNDQR